MPNALKCLHMLINLIKDMFVYMCAVVCVHTTCVYACAHVFVNKRVCVHVYEEKNVS